VKDAYKNTYPYFGEEIYPLLISSSGDFYKCLNERYNLFIDDVDSLIIAEHKKLYYEFLKNIEPDRRKFAMFVQTIYIKHDNGTKFPVMIKKVPFSFDNNRFPWAYVGRISISTKLHKPIMNIVMLDTKELFFYDFKKDCFSTVCGPTLTKAEQRVLILCSRGYTEKAAAEEINVTHNTIKKHKSNILNKLGVDRISEAIILASNFGLL
jgi:DNA-binding CsgD family transcriptional regulator